jgi:DNA-binding LacI/PurR family transcriptional regulator
LTTVKQHAEDIGKAAAGKLIERLENDNEDLKYEQKVIKSVIIEREST